MRGYTATCIKTAHKEHKAQGKRHVQSQGELSMPKNRVTHLTVRHGVTAPQNRTRKSLRTNDNVELFWLMFQMSRRNMVISLILTRLQEPPIKAMDSPTSQYEARMLTSAENTESEW
eukprot:TRINITY_DN18506_c0_g3_i1.p3 TRINITY_DN18506_c0_g3~~TRINITY_DN18506_c0_g3_i1.p3  ORF type:complete len:117 (-),score=15.41 TRINITY_DN18506_c0_g3_i1:438-788(-)